MSELWEPMAGVFWKTTPLLPMMDNLQALGNSSFFTTVIGALAGAFFGAWAAQRNAENSKLRDELLREIQASNRGIMLGHSIVNVALSMKNQHIATLKKSYDDDLARLKEYQIKTAPKVALTVSPVLMRLPGINSTDAALQKLIVDQSSEKAFRAIMALSEAIGNFNDTIAVRNGILDNVKNGSIPRDFKFEDIYFGLPVNGNINNEYGDTIKGIYNYNNDIIFYSIKLCEYLQTHAESIAKEYKKRFRKKIKIYSTDLVAAKSAGLLPNEEDYESWLSGYIEEKKIISKKWWTI